jgi:hypothetical protein
VLCFVECVMLSVCLIVVRVMCVVCLLMRVIICCLIVVPLPPVETPFAVKQIIIIKEPPLDRRLGGTQSRSGRL